MGNKKGTQGYSEWYDKFISHFIRQNEDVLPVNFALLKAEDKRLAYSVINPLLKLKERFENKKITGNNGIIHINLSEKGDIEPGDDKFCVDLTLDRNTKDAYIKLFNLREEDRGKHIQTDFMSSLVNELKAQGFEKIELSAEALGPYTWPIYGFTMPSDIYMNLLDFVPEKKRNSIEASIYEIENIEQFEEPLFYKGRINLHLLRKEGYYEALSIISKSTLTLDLTDDLTNKILEERFNAKV